MKSDGWEYFIRFYNLVDLFTLIAYGFFITAYFNVFKLVKNETIAYVPPDPDAKPKPSDAERYKDWHAHYFLTNQLLTITLLAGIFRGMTTFLRFLKYTRFLTFMV